MKKDSVKCFFGLLLFLLFLEILIGLLIIVLSEYMEHILHNHIYQIDKQQVLNIFFMIKLYGLHICFFFLCGSPIMCKLNEAYTQHLGLLIKLWLLLAFETVIGAFFIAKFSHDAGSYLKEKFESSLKYGMTLYDHDSEWKFIWDEIQYDYHCCGLGSFSDWDNLTISRKGAALSDEDDR